ncbi:enoyl-CoA hydratase/isomerase family protein [Nocardia pseudobrasiliensis]|uniref:Enoyl-CoA hydratase/carnithine racemase n=1 Tax=Nocardia pseudobrasiliensis TaxID=45979 RepID=A0A370IBB3_9NOCA|nr:enoyl-CoA hydratase/isomerase family protein [Nocardia pseudobrasiliensis]RDI67997.1 enoyl-CoA hydratase/carnithine racemase [Nocardia pseudobrasiliensis]
MYRRLLVEHYDRVLLVRFDNPPRHFFDDRMSIELDDLTRRLRSDRDTRAVVFTGQGQTYMTHFDVPELVRAAEQIPLELSYAAAKLIVAAGIPGRARGVDRLLRRTRARELLTMTRTYATLRRLRTSDKVVLTAVNGLALGMGCIFALGCDIRLMAENRQLGLPESGLGLLAAAGGTQSLVRMVGPGRALELLLEGRWLDAPEAVDLGLIHHAVPAAELLPETLTVAHRLATRSPRITREIKRMVYDAGTRPSATAARMEAAALLATMTSKTTEHRLRAYHDRLNTSGPVTDDLVRQGFSTLLRGDDMYG